MKRSIVDKLGLPDEMIHKIKSYVFHDINIIQKKKGVLSQIKSAISSKNQNPFFKSYWYFRLKGERYYKCRFCEDCGNYIERSDYLRCIC